MSMCRVPHALAAIVLLVAFTGPAGAVDTLIVVRHAEKVADWPRGEGLDALHPLSEPGRQRAESLAEALTNMPVRAVYGSPTARSIHTGLPTALRHGLAPVADARTIDAEALADWLAALPTAHPEPGVVLLVGHSNTIPMVFDAVGADAACQRALGVTEESYGPATAFYDGLWEIDLEVTGCDAITRRRQDD